MSNAAASVTLRRATWQALFVLCLCVLPFASSAFAQNYTLVHKFHSDPSLPIGRLVEGPDGSLYGTTLCGVAGCAGGTIFALRPQPAGRWSFEALHHMRPDLYGGRPSGGLTLSSDGQFYGIATFATRPPPEIAHATIFRMSSSGSLSTLHVFGLQEPGVGGEDPIGRLAEASDGNFYGSTCRFGRSTPLSSIFRITPAGVFTTIHTFRMSDLGSMPVDGFCPVTELKQGQDGLLYGTAVAGGRPIPELPQVSSLGTLFRLDHRITPAPLTVLHTFRGLDGAFPTGGLTPGGSGDFFGTTLAGGIFGRGVVYRLDSSGVVSTVHTFFGLDGAAPFGTLFRSADDALYGTTLAGGFGYGTVFRLDSSGFTPLHWFTGQDGSGPVEVMRARDGNFYGVTATGGARGGGTVFRLGADNSLETVHTFAAEPRWPDSGVIQASDGNFYGTTQNGKLGGGSVFKLTPSGQLTIVHEFERPAGIPLDGSGAGPSGLVEGDDGFLYGYTRFDGAHNSGTIFRLAKSGGLTVLHHLQDCNGSHGLLKGSDGHIYGTTANHAASTPVIFRVEPSGRVSTVYLLADGGVSGLSGPLVEGPDGALYGVGSGSGPFNGGGLFKVTKSGTFTFLYSFDTDSEIGDAPRVGLMRSSDGGFYGTTSRRSFGVPSIFRFDPETNSIALVAHVFATSSLFEARDGTIYGWTGSYASPFPLPRWFRVFEGTVEYFYDMVEADGLRPSPIIQASDGALYGTVSEGPSNFPNPETWSLEAFAGGVFRLTIPPLPSTAATRRR